MSNDQEIEISPELASLFTDDRKEFFLVTLPGLEDLVHLEVSEWFPELESGPEHGGVTVRASLPEGLAMNRALKTPTRILLRVASFRCRDFPKLYQKFSAFNWREWIDPTCDLEIHVSATRSRLKMKKRIEETCLKAWRAYQKKAAVKPGSKIKIGLYVRLSDDICTLSLDTSGDRLHKRGARVHIGEAPLRETIAASMLQWMGRTRWAGSDDPVELIDPMMGSGTFLLEAVFRDRLIEERDFAFSAFGATPINTPLLRSVRPRFSKLLGFEMDKKTLAAAKENLSAVKGAFDFELNGEDFFKAKPRAETPGLQRWIVANPPYGERLKVKEPLAKYYAKLFAQAELVAKPELACFILPASAAKGRLDLPPQWKVVTKRAFSNGGIPVVAFVFGRTGKS